MECLAKIVENESEMKIEFNQSLTTFQILKFVDKNNNPIDLYKFISYYEIPKKRNEKSQNEIFSSDNFIETKETREQLKNSKQIKEIKERITVNCQSKTTINLYQHLKDIKMLLEEEHELNSSKHKQNVTMIRKLNCAMLFYILTKCEGYSMDLSKGISREKGFIYINCIKYKDELIYNWEEIEKQIQIKSQSTQFYVKRKIQVEKLAEIIEKES